MKFPFNNQEYYINKWLATNLTTLCYNIKKDWDFLILVTGDRTVRTGKSVIAMIICAYMSYILNRMKIKTNFSLDNVYFDSKKMISDALTMPKHSIIQYDEGREALASSKSFTTAQKDILDYFAECGQLNHIFVIVLPDFFNLVEEIAVARSEYLINVYRKDVKIETDLFYDGEKHPIVRFDRGQFEFFNRYSKQILYDKSKAMRIKSYGLVKAQFLGDFLEQYPVNEAEYKAKKKDWLRRFKERKEDELKARNTDVFRDRIVQTLHNEGKSGPRISEILAEQYHYYLTSSAINKLLLRLAKRQIETTGAEKEEE